MPAACWSSACGPARDRMAIDYLFLIAQGTPEGALPRIHCGIAVTDRGDIAILRSRAAQSLRRIYRAGRLSPKHEQGVAWFQKEVQRALG